jgi:hypothetical protein
MEAKRQALTESVVTLARDFSTALGGHPPLATSLANIQEGGAIARNRRTCAAPDSRTSR